MNKLLPLLFILFAATTVQAQTGTWKNYLAYYDIQDVEKAGSRLFVQASGGLFVYDANDQSIQTYDKVNGLNDCTVEKIKYNSTVRKLLIVYDNQNIDLMRANGEVTNMGEYRNASISGSKNINDVFLYNQYAYLSTGFGIVRLNMEREEVSDTYQLGFSVAWTNIAQGFINAYSEVAGHYQARLDANLQDLNSWTRVGDYAEKSSEQKDSLLAFARTLAPGGPRWNHFQSMRFKNDRLYTVSGYFTHVTDANLDCTPQVLNPEDGTWQIYELPSNRSYRDMETIDIDPTDSSHVFTGGRTGLYEYRGGRFVNDYYMGDGRSPIASTLDQNYTLIMGLNFDNNGNLWILNSMSPTSNILVYDAQRQWHSFRQQSLMDNGHSLYLLRKPIFDSRGLLWFVNSHWEQRGVGFYNTSQDSIRFFTQWYNEDGNRLEISYFYDVKEDREGNIWIATNLGPLEIEAANVSSANEYSFVQVKVPRNDGTDYADYLLDGVDIRAIAIDSGNRKWFATNGNGVYLISSDNYQQLQHFTSENSPLLSDVVQSIAINDKTGEVFFGTDKGLCSYMSDATQTNDHMTKDNVWAYPNPVRPEYNGPITITGLSYNADVKIVSTNGTIVNEGRSNGGTYIWYGKDKRGRRVATGVYMVLTATSDGKKGTVCKIAIVN